MTRYFDADLLDADENADYDFADFETRDALDDRDTDLLREVVFGLPARPGTRR